MLGGNDYIAEFFRKHKKNVTSQILEKNKSVDSYTSCLAALRTKPFMLLAGISGTGKSRIVREFAFKSCPPALQDAEGTTPGNYCMIEVKPNWHDSTEILGYYSNISKKYHFTKFVKFLVKAMMFPDVPFFVCLDEMNLAPVEQYFAEFLSVLETRKKDKDKKVIQSGVLVAPEYFAPILNADSGNGYIAKYLCPEINVNIPHDIYTNKSLTTIGLTLPDNVFIIGTVNMDDTTHQFSRKVIDRAMTIEMNGGKLEDMFGHSADLQYLPEDQIMELSDFKPEYVNADEVMEAHSEYAETLQEKLVEKLDIINNCLKNTPFQVSYRVLNELCIYAGVLLDDGEDIDNAISKAVNQITLMKILPRIEGDEDMFVTKDGNKLEQLQEILGKDSASGVKLEEMKERLKNSSFTRFWP
jgi:5-methylcytosine-specific restriction endonuclease McrBC GTP-binding regulatory subunit McrB